MILPEKKPTSVTKLLNISSPIPDYVTMSGHISKSSYTRKQQKEFLRTWTAIGRTHVSSSHGPDLFQLLDIASSNLVADNDSDNCRLLYAAYPLPAGATLYIPNSIAAIYISKLRATSTFLFSSSGLLGKGPASSGQVSRLGSTVFGGFPSAIPAPPTGDTLFSSKPTSDAAPTHNTSSIFDASYISKSS
jgi:hypothetical protein